MHSNESDDEAIEPSNVKVGSDTTVKFEWIPRSRFRREQNKIKKQPISVVFNISSIILTPSMESLLNRGLNFAVLPNKLDITQVLVDWKRFERTMIWREWWFGREAVEDIKEQIFKTKKSNLPKNYKMPNGLRTYVTAVKSEIIDPKNRNKVKSNLTVEEHQALKDLVRLQKEKTIVIKQCDKGAGIIIMDHKDYVKAAEEHLKETIVNAEGNEKPLYTKVNDNLFNEAKNKLQALLMSGFDNDIISKQELEAMCPESKTMSKFYCNFKVHKQYEHIPPVRPIISGSGSLLENPSKFVDYHIKELATKHDTYLQDTPDFLRKVEELNSKGSLPDNALLVTIDVKGLFTNIPQEEGTQATEEALNERDVQTVPSEFIVAMLRIILKNNIFTFNEDIYSQEEGSGMGPKHTPHYADIFMARNIDPFIKILAKKYEEGTIDFMKRFLDDLFKIFIGTTKNLHLLFDEMNQMHPSHPVYFQKNSAAPFGNRSPQLRGAWFCT